MFASYVEFITRCANSYQTVSGEESLDDLPIAIGTRVRILKGEYPNNLKLYQGCAATIVDCDLEARERSYKLCEESTKREIGWYKHSDLIPCPKR